jgi:hypothetical protein
MLTLVALTAVLVPAQPLALDHSWSEQMRDLQTPLLTDRPRVFNWLGRAPGRAIAITGLLLLRGRRWLAVIAFAVAESLSQLCSGLLKTLVDSPRPPGRAHPPARHLLPVRPRPPTPQRRARRSSFSSRRRAATPTVVDARHPPHHRHGLEPYLPAGALAH